MNCPKGIRARSSKRRMSLIAELKGLCTKARSNGTKQEGLVTTAQMENYALIIITETWWDKLYDRCAVIEGYRLCRRGRRDRSDLYVKNEINCMDKQKCAGQELMGEN